MNPEVKIAFERRIAVLPVQEILPLRSVPASIKNTVKYKRIVRSIAEVGVIEPLVVAQPKKPERRFVLLDGHLRYTALLEAGEANVQCLISDDDEAFTYNKRINRLATIQEHYMLVRAIDRGVSEERLARALNINMKAIRRRRGMLNGICPEVIDLLKDKSVNPNAFEILRKMRPLRQIEAAELMATAGNYSSSYAGALLAATKQADLVKADSPKSVAGLTSEQMARMEREMEALQRDMKTVESRYGDDVLHLVIASAYLAKLVGNRNVKRYLTQHHPEILAEFFATIAATSPDQAMGAA
jgi:ParB-like chromosome segregation protein Spo0J